MSMQPAGSSYPNQQGQQQVKPGGPVPGGPGGAGTPEGSAYKHGAGITSDEPVMMGQGPGVFRLHIAPSPPALSDKFGAQYLAAAGAVHLSGGVNAQPQPAPTSGPAPLSDKFSSQPTIAVVPAPISIQGHPELGSFSSIAAAIAAGNRAFPPASFFYVMQGTQVQGQQVPGTASIASPPASAVLPTATTTVGGQTITQAGLLTANNAAAGIANLTGILAATRTRLAVEQSLDLTDQTRPEYFEYLSWWNANVNYRPAAQITYQAYINGLIAADQAIVSSTVSQLQALGVANP